MKDFTKKQIDATIRKLREKRKNAPPDREFPAERAVLHQFLIESQGPTPTVSSNGDGEISCRAVTDWYVKKYCEKNHLVLA
jgi:hypothetical protein